VSTMNRLKRSNCSRWVPRKSNGSWKAKND
jgi:hypothetical protein